MIDSFKGKYWSMDGERQIRGARKFPSDMTIRVRGQDAREVTLSHEEANHMKEILEGQRQRFIKKFGREPSPEDPIFFNEDAEEPEPMTEEHLREVMAISEEFGVDLEAIAEDRRRQQEKADRVRRPGRNEPCRCGSGKKFKKCCGR